MGRPKKGRIAMDEVSRPPLEGAAHDASSTAQAQSFFQSAPSQNALLDAQPSAFTDQENGPNRQLEQESSSTAQSAPAPQTITIQSPGPAPQTITTSNIATNETPAEVSPNKPFKSRPTTSDQTRILIVRLLLEPLKPAAIAHTAQVSLQTVYGIRRNLLTYGTSIAPDKNPIGTPPKMKKEVQDRLWAWLVRDGWKELKEMAEWLEREEDVKVSASSISRMLAKNGWNAGLVEATQRENERLARREQQRSERGEKKEKKRKRRSEADSDPEAEQVAPSPAS